MRRAERRDNSSAPRAEPLKSDIWPSSGAAEAQTGRRASARGEGEGGRPLTGMTEEVTVGGGGRSGDASPGFERWRDCVSGCARRE